MNRESLAALTRGIHHAASSTHAMLANQYMHMMMQFFDEKEGKLFAKMTYIQLDDKHWIPVPLISLVAPKGLALERMKVELSVRIEAQELKMATIDHDGSTADRLSLKVAMSPRTKESAKRRSDIVDIELVFNAGDPPESIMRIIDSFANLIDPQNFDKAKPPTDRYPQTPIQFKGEKAFKKQDQDKEKPENKD